MLPANKTKIICTIGPACSSRHILEKMILAGMNVARLNFSHGDFSGHEAAIGNIRAAARAVGRHVALMADLPGPKMRIGSLDEEVIELVDGDDFTLTTETIIGNRKRVHVNYSRLPQVVRPGDSLFLNDGLIQLEAIKVEGNEVHCRVIVGGELRSRKGLNLPGIDLGVSAFTDNDHRCLRFALEHGVDAVSQSFVESASDIRAVRNASAAMGYAPFIIAKIERSRALNNIEDILREADGIMVARGDLGVEIPIEQISVAQKRLVSQANLHGKPVIIATQMLESMVEHRRPTCAESTDVANAILDGTDCVMLSAESAIGKYPVEAVAMLARIATATEPYRLAYTVSEAVRPSEGAQNGNLQDLIAYSVETYVRKVSPAAILVPTRSGDSARSIARFRLPVWVTAVSSQESACRRLQFSYGVYPVHAADYPEDWKAFAVDWLETHNMRGDLVLLIEGPSPKHPVANHRMEIIDLGED